jgi:O-antigen/teichoic acid export membrane protein
LNNPRTLVKNSIINFGSQIIIVVLAILIVPLIVKTLGDAKYGLLSLAFVAFGSLGLLELGLGRATTKFVSAGLARSDLPGAAKAVWTSLCVQLALGSVFAIWGWFLSPSIASWLNLPIALRAEGILVFQVLALSTPIVLTIAVLRGTLEGCQRFDLVSYMKLFTNGSLYVIPLLLGLSGYSVSLIVVGLVVVRLGIAIALFWLCSTIIHDFAKFYRIELSLLQEMLKYSSWAGISNLLVPLLVQLERIFISAWAGIEQVAYYAVSYEIINGLWVIPGSIAAVLFPAFSVSAERGGVQSAELFKRPIRYLLVLLGPCCIFISVFSYEILKLWQGQTIAQQANGALTLLTIGVLIGSLGWIPSNLFFGYNRPDVPTKNQVLQVPIYVLLCSLLIPKFGIIGAAISFITRTLFETAFYYFLAMRMFPFTKHVLNDKRIFYALLANIILALSMYVLKAYASGLTLLFGIIVLGSAFMHMTWFQLLDDSERDLALSTLRLRRTAV